MLEEEDLLLPEEEELLLGVLRVLGVLGVLGISESSVLKRTIPNEKVADALFFLHWDHQ